METHGQASPLVGQNLGMVVKQFTRPGLLLPLVPRGSAFRNGLRGPDPRLEPEKGKCLILSR